MSFAHIFSRSERRLPEQRETRVVVVVVGRGRNELESHFLLPPFHAEREMSTIQFNLFLSSPPSLSLFPFPFEELNATPGKKKGKGKREGANEIFNLPPGPPHHLSSSFPKGGRRRRRRFFWGGEKRRKRPT